MNREDFSIFQNFEKEHNKKLIYLDNAASSLTPDSVVDAMSLYYKNFRSNIDRSFGITSDRASFLYESTRKNTASFLNVSEDEIIFTSGSTDSFNKAFLMLENFLDLSQDDTVLVGESEHHSVLMPILNLQKKKKFKIDKIILDENYKVDIVDFKNKLQTNVKIVFLQHVSNITGSINDLKEIVSICKKQNIIIVSDGSQMVGHRKVDLKEMGVDVYFFSGHKMLAPTGTGVLYVKKSLLSKLEPVFLGGGTVKEISETDFILRGDIKKYEPGTQNIGGVIGFGTAISYLEKIGLEKIEKEINSLTYYLLESLRKLSFIKIYTSSDIKENIGIVSFTLLGIHSHDVSFLLNEKGIMTRSGFFCSEVFVKKMTKDSLIRISLAFYNKEEDIDSLIENLKEIKNRLS